MECPQCKNPLSIENTSVCEWCGNQLATENESFLKKIKRLLSNFAINLPTNKKRLYIVFTSISVILLFLILRNNLDWKHWFSEKGNALETTNKQEIIPKGLNQTRAFEYLTKVRKELVENPDSLLSSCKIIEVAVDNGQLDSEFDEMAAKLEVNKVSEIFEIREGNGILIQYAIMIVLEKGNGFYKAKYITSNIELQIGQYYQGGIIFQLDENAEHGLIAAKKDLGSFWWDEAKQKCEELELNEYDDWYLPSNDELYLLHTRKDEIGGFVNSCYWSSTEFDLNRVWGICFEVNYHPTINGKSNSGLVRAVRAF
jgi:hypothetical protein